jgi:hypothetical protein
MTPLTSLALALATLLTTVADRDGTTSSRGEPLLVVVERGRNVTVSPEMIRPP